MTAGTVAKAEQFLTLLDDLAGAKPNGATAAVLLAHAATHLRGLLELIDEHDRGLMAEAELDEVLDRVRENVREQVAANLAKPDLSHLPPMAADGEDMCGAESRPDQGGGTWCCNARRGHPERWHASHEFAEDGARPLAATYADAAWPVTDQETGLPSRALSPSLECLAWFGRWECNAVQGHAPLDHVAFADEVRQRTAGAVLARWASVQPGQLPAAVAEAVAATDLPGDLLKHAPELAPVSIQMQPSMNGHALRPPEWVCAACGNRFPGRKPEDGLCAKCGWPEDRLPDAIASLRQPAPAPDDAGDGPFRLAAVPDDAGEAATP